VLPVTIYGFASGPFVDLGIQNKSSIQIPILIQKSLDRGQGGMIGQGKNIWNNVHVDEGQLTQSICFFGHRTDFFISC
jgi:hypothetical protein